MSSTRIANEKAVLHIKKDAILKNVAILRRICGIDNDVSRTIDTAQTMGLSAVKWKPNVKRLTRFCL